MFMGCENGGRVRGKGFLIIVLLGGIGGLGYRYLPSYYNPLLRYNLPIRRAGSLPSNYSA